MINKEEVLHILRGHPIQYPKVLEEKFPHILKKIIQLWNNPEGGLYLADLLQPNGRSGGRMERDGFPENAWQEIFQLQQIYAKPRARAFR
jgi:hypothetical protein